MSTGCIPLLILQTLVGQNNLTEGTSKMSSGIFMEAVIGVLQMKKMVNHLKKNKILI